jgi:hypothetical protein
MKIKQWLSMFSGLCIFKNIGQDSVLLALKAFLEAAQREEESEKLLFLYNEYAYQLLEKDSCFSITHYIADKILYTPTVFTKKLEERAYESLFPTFQFELGLLYELTQITSQKLKKLMIERTTEEASKQMIQNLVEWDTEKTVFPFKEGDFKQWAEVVVAFYHEKGTGDFARYYAFTWSHERGLKGVLKPDPISLGDLVSYELQKKEVTQNTERFLAGYEGNNLLLYGARGTGKSSLVKAVVNAYHTKGLKLIEVSKENLIYFEELIALLQNKRQKFILFVDDLAFEDNEDSYTALKTILEGGICVKPSNLLIYATSNRRHLVKEKLSDRSGLFKGGSDEVHARDVIEEKLSLADRFGKTISFSSPNQNQYLEIVRQMAKSKNIMLDEETLKLKAIQWEMINNGRSGRTAKQFILDLEGSLTSSE